MTRRWNRETSWTFGGRAGLLMNSTSPHAIPLTLSLSPNGGEGARRAGEGEARFMAPIRVQSWRTWLPMKLGALTVFCALALNLGAADTPGHDTTSWPT